MKLYQNIKRLREENGWSQDTLAKKIGYTDRSSIAKIEAGKVDIPRSKIVAFAHAFSVDPIELMGLDETFGDDIDRHQTVSEIDTLFNLLTPSDRQLVLNLIHSLVEAKK